jgi:hypothetical protein
LLAAIHVLFEALCRINREAFLSAVKRELEVSMTRVVIKANAVANYFTLLNWVNQVLQLASADQENLLKHLPDLVRWQATLLQLCLAEGKKKGLKISAISMTRACMRKLFQQKDSNLSGNTVQSYIKILAGSRMSPFAAAISLGTVAGVSCRLRSKVASDVVESLKNVFYDFFVKEMVGSKIRIPSYVMVSPMSLWNLIVE